MKDTLGSDVWLKFNSYIEGIFFFDVMTSSQVFTSLIGQLAYTPENGKLTWIRKPYGIDENAIRQKVEAIIRSVSGQNLG